MLNRILQDNLQTNNYQPAAQTQNYFTGKPLALIAKEVT